MADDVGAAGGPEGPGMRSRGSFRGELGSSTEVEVEPWVRVGVKPQGCGAQGGKGWTTITKLGHLVKDMKTKSLEIYLISMLIKESENADCFLGVTFHDGVLKITLAQKQISAGQRTRLKAFVVTGDYSGHGGLGVGCSKEVAMAIHGAMILTKFSLVSGRRGYCRSKISKPHTNPGQVTDPCGFVPVHLTTASTLGNFTRVAFDAISKTYSDLTPKLWKKTMFSKPSYQEFTDHLVKTHARASV